MAPTLLLLLFRDTIFSFQVELRPGAGHHRRRAAAVRDDVPAAVRLHERLRVPALRLRGGGGAGDVRRHRGDRLRAVPGHPPLAHVVRNLTRPFLRRGRVVCSQRGNVKSYEDREREHQGPGRARGPSPQPEAAAVERLASNVGNQAFGQLAREGAGILPSGMAHPDVQQAIARRRGQGAPLDGSVRDRFESSLGEGLDDVRVHTGTEADALARSVSARAFTTGTDVYFAAGEYRPGDGRGASASSPTSWRTSCSSGERPRPGPLRVSQPGEPLEQRGGRRQPMGSRLTADRFGFDRLDACIRGGRREGRRHRSEPDRSVPRASTSPTSSRSPSPARAGDGLDARLDAAAAALGLGALESCGARALRCTRAEPALRAALRLPPRRRDAQARRAHGWSRACSRTARSTRPPCWPASIRQRPLRRPGAIRLVDAAGVDPARRAASEGGRPARLLPARDAPRRARRRRPAPLRSRCPHTSPAGRPRSMSYAALLAGDSSLPLVVAGPDAATLLAVALGRPLVLARRGGRGRLRSDERRRPRRRARGSPALLRRARSARSRRAASRAARRWPRAASACLICAARAGRRGGARRPDRPRGRGADAEPRRAARGVARPRGRRRGRGRRRRSSASRSARSPTRPRSRAWRRPPAATQAPARADLDLGARQASSTRLGELATRLEPAYGWDDLVLPAAPARGAALDLGLPAPPRPRALGVGLRAGGRARPGPEGAVRGRVGHRQDDGRPGARPRPRARALPDRPGDGRLEVHRRDREEPRPHLRRRRRAPTRSSSSTRPTRSSASAPRSATRTTATRTSRSPTCCSRWRPTTARSSWRRTSARTSTTPSCAGSTS